MNAVKNSEECIAFLEANNQEETAEKVDFDESQDTSEETATEAAASEEEEAKERQQNNNA